MGSNAAGTTAADLTLKDPHGGGAHSHGSVGWFVPTRGNETGWPAGSVFPRHLQASVTLVIFPAATYPEKLDFPPQLERFP